MVQPGQITRLFKDIWQFVFSHDNQYYIQIFQTDNVLYWNTNNVQDYSRAYVYTKPKNQLNSAAGDIGLWSIVPLPQNSNIYQIVSSSGHNLYNNNNDRALPLV